MKAGLISVLKILIPLAFGAFIIWAFYDAMCDSQRDEMFRAFSEANYWWVAASLIFGFLSHVSRAWRWRYLLEPLGEKPPFWITYHSVMTGYLVNYMFPRAGEASRAAILTRHTKLKFDKVFGTIIAERAIDVLMLGIVVGITLLLQMDKIDLFQAQIEQFQGNESGCGSSPILTWMGRIVTWLIIGGVIAGIVLAVVKKSFRDKFIQLAKGVWEGITTILRSNYKGLFIGHTVFIWIMYILFFGICFPALESTSGIGVDGILGGFVAGTIGIVLVQGGIGVYPAFVGLILTTYIDAGFDMGIHPQALALGWLIWTSQTVMMIVLGLISLICTAQMKQNDDPGSDPS